MIDRRGPSVGSSWILGLGLIALLATSLRAAAQLPPSLPGDFANAVARLGPPPILRRSMSAPDSPPRVVIGLDRYRDEAAALRARYGTGSLPYLTGLVAEFRSNDLLRTRRELAFATLASLAEDEAAARVLERGLSDRESHDLLPLVAATYAPAKIGRRLGLEALSDPPSRPRSLGDAAVLLRFFGEPEDLAGLERAIGEAGMGSGDGASRIESDVVAMRQRLDRLTAERAGWTDDDLAIWRGARYIHDHSAGGNLGLPSNALGLAARGRCRPAYLKDRLTANPIDLDELYLVISATKNQAERSLTPELVIIASDGREGWPAAATALMSIGDQDGLGALRALLLPPSPSPATSKAEVARHNRRTQLLSRLTGQNVFEAATPATLEFWSALSEDPAFQPAERAAFARARDVVRSILATKPEGLRL